MEAWFGLAGVALGAVLAWFIKVDERKRAPEYRWDRDRHEVYVEFVEAGTSFERCVAALHRDPAALAHPDRVEVARLGAAYERVRIAFVKITLLAPDPVPFQAMLYVSALATSPFTPEDRAAYGPFGWADHVYGEGDPFAQARGDFIKAVRDDLGMKSSLGYFNSMADWF